MHPFDSTAISCKSSSCLGCYKKPTLITSVDEPSKGSKIQGQTVKKPSISEEFWTTSTCDMDKSAVQSQGSMSSISTINQTHDLHGGSSSTSAPAEFVNHGLLLWNQTRQRWVGDKRSMNRAQQSQEPKLKLGSSTSLVTQRGGVDVPRQRWNDELLKRFMTTAGETSDGKEVAVSEGNKKSKLFPRRRGRRGLWRSNGREFVPQLYAQGLVLSSNGENLQQQRKHMVLGSKPPGCVNKCFSCKPCMATLVVPSHQKDPTFKALSHGDDDDSGRYYLLSWKCRCGEKLFQP
ncbi:hypothetical protein GH714_002292 [Hevea brasiliensis]|uniref:Gag1-like clamp domain-containing protein n=1 Tax=Hevea brasiliensis TaxID=3981 RepID=A0A6A6LH87_HEVBR|nr:hypothetical protein GH714_002292 [Hevea brasiliensis]